MNLLMLFIAVVLAITTSGEPVHAAVDNNGFHEDGPHVIKPFSDRVVSLYKARKFAELDAMADTFLVQKSGFFPDGLPKLRTFALAFYLDPNQPEADFTTAIKLAEEWRRVRPKSVHARITLAGRWSDYAWKARGDGFAGEVDPRAWPVFQKRLDTAWGIINEPLPPGMKDSPERHCLRLGIATSRSMDRKEFEAIFNEAVRLYPDYINIYFKKVNYLTPKWHGKPGDWQRFLADVARKNPKGVGATIYARTVDYMEDEVKDFKTDSLSWETTKSGFKQIMQHYPQSPYNLNTFAVFACMAKDHETLPELLNAIDSKNYYNDVWRLSGYNINNCRKSVGLDPMKKSRNTTPKFEQGPNQKASEKVKSVCNNHLQMAEDGNFKILGQLADCYLSGKVIPANPVAAYAWLAQNEIAYKERIAGFEKRLTPEQMNQARQLTKKIQFKLRHVNKTY